MSLLNSAAPWFCPCCSDIVLFVDLFNFINLILFDFVCLEQCYIGNGWHAWMGLGDIWDCISFLVTAQEDGGAPVYVTHAIATPMHVCVRNGLPFHFVV